VKNVNMLTVAIAALMLSPAMSSAVDRVGDFSLLDQDGYHHSMSWYDDHKMIALLVQANDSQAAADALPVFDALKAKYDGQGVEFLMINPMGELNRSAVQAQSLEYGVDIPILMDDARVISEALGIERAGEVLLYNPRSFMVEYRGSVELSEKAIQEILAGEDVGVALVTTSGPAISYAATAVPSYIADIAPILADNCATCHREGGIAPFAMDSHTMVQGWSPMIREVLMTKRMPPGQIGSEFVESFHNVNHITIEETQKLVSWINAGSPNNNDSDPLRSIFASHPKAGKKISIDPFDLISGKNIKGSWGGASKPDKDIPLLAGLYKKGMMPLEKLVTKTYKLDEINTALDDLKNSKVFRPLIVMDDF
jgi:hypothetical protein